ncbi:metal-dependent hydrolase [Undibacterium sp. TS12]|uniref:metal-dependent hydrolase n=1 Tax=Undibacterium sp. TS12 TaxID=2908202 RepID=UPI001F4C6B84|nr:metal-dependent hydrolase [Undibacterium sp. TS12]MCH8618859.1 metal-dependent hydrolase [Undibacterium sp. TS12]
MNTSSNPAATGLHTLWWNDGDAFRSRLFDAISLLLPCGEHFVVTAVNDWLNTNSHSSCTPQLQYEVQRLVREEQTHSRAHRLYNERMATHAPAQRLEQRIESAMQQMAVWTLPTRIAFAAAFEQLTVLLAEQVLRPHNVWLGQNDTQQTRLWQWHCQEEIEHRYVVQDVADAMKIGKRRCALIFLVAACYLFTDITFALASLLWTDIRAQRVGMVRVSLQAVSFTIRAIPSLLRMAGAGLRHVVMIKS